jgi:amino acid adenylation domain-containing protein/non-ribosomal peptide synthase protein (TIGR01720 family)
VAELAAVVGRAPAAQAEQGPVVGEAPLLPIQRWFFGQPLPERHHFNQSVLLTVPPGLDHAALRAALAALLAHHDALRASFVEREGAWRQVLQAPAADAADRALERVDLRGLEPDALSAEIERRSAAAQASLDLAGGPLLRVLHFDCGPDEPGRLLLAIHHLVVDGVSWRVLLEDLQSALAQVQRGEVVRLPPKTSSLKAWAERLASYAVSEELARERAYWLETAQADLPPLPLDDPRAPRGAATTAAAERVLVELSAEETRALLQDVPPVYNTQINDLLLTALARALGDWTGQRQVRIALEGHGRADLFEEIDLSRTVGWFTSMYPLLLDLGERDDLGAQLCAVKEQLRAVPSQGLGYGLLRWLASGGAELEPAAPVEVLFNYLGQLDQTLDDDGPFGIAPESSGPGEGAGTPLSHLLNIGGQVVDGQLRLSWLYSPGHHRAATVAALAQRFIAELRALIAHCARPDAGRATPSDFALLRAGQDLLDRALALAGVANSRAARQQVEDIYPLSPMQQGMLFHSLSAPETGAYAEQLSVALGGDLDLDHLERAWQAAVARHAILRTAFVWEQLPEPLQVVHRSAAAPTLRLDWRAVPPEERAARLARWLADDCARGFDLSRAPLMRLTFIRLDDQTVQFVWSYHHILLDGWSLPILLQEVFSAYDQLCDGQEVGLAAPRPYRDYIAWLQRQDMRQAETFWRARLAGFQTPSPLGIERPGSAPSLSADAGAEHTLNLDAGLTEALQALARDQQVTLNTLVQGAWALLLGRQGLRDDVLFGATVAGRPAEIPGVEGMVGLFINTLPVRVRLRPEQPLGEWLRDLQARQLEQQRFEYTPLLQIQRWSELPPGQALFESLLVFENYPVGEALAEQPEQRGLETEVLGTVDKTNYALTLSAIPGPQLQLQLQYDSARFEPQAVEALARRLGALLEQFAAAPARPLAALSLLDADERRRTLGEWNATALDLPGQALLPQLVEAHAARTPDAPAVVWGGQQLSYAQLNARANRLARRLRGYGVGPERRVGICLERSADLVVAVLAVHKAGAAYLPLDPSYPPRRLEQMIGDAGVTLVITDDPGRAQAAGADTGAAWVELAALMRQLEREPASNLGLPPHPDQLAYVIFTSGSTGKPKGVMVSHAMLRGAFWAWERAYGLGGVRRHLQLASFSFDVFAGDLTRALGSGGALVLCPRELLLDPPALLEIIQREQIECVEFVPAVLRELARHLAETGQTMPPLRLLICGSDRWLGHEYAQVRRLCRPETRLINSFGVTEATIDSTLFEGPPESAAPEQNVPIGRALPNTQLYVLDRWLQPAPVGVAGELYIGGAGVARGYLGRPDLTAERFVPNPFTERSNDTTVERLNDLDDDRSSALPFYRSSARLYRTGDQARWRADGQLEFLGRADEQVKVRGFRIELGEIESALAAHPQVREAVVLARTGPAGGSQLVAYVTLTDEGRTTNDEGHRASPDLAGAALGSATDKPRDGDREESRPSSLVGAALLGLGGLRRRRQAQVERADQEARPEQAPAAPAQARLDLRGFLAERLPDHMLPSAFVTLDALPLTPNGKVDRRALPAPEQAGAADGDQTAPRSPLEQRLALIWAEVLGLERVGVEASFFELGGHSLLALQLQSRVQAELGRSLPVAALLGNPTVADMARLLEGGSPAGEEWPVLVPLRQGGARPPLLLVSPGAWYAIQYQALAERLGGDQPVYALQPPGLEWEREPYPSVEQIAAAYLREIVRLQPAGPYYLGGWSFGGEVALEVAQQLTRRGQRVALLTLIDTFLSADLKPYDSVEVFVAYAEAVGAEIDQEYLRTLSYPEQLRYVLRLARLHGMVGGAEAEQLRRVFDTMRATSLAGASYQPQPYDGDLLFFRATAPDQHRPEVNPAQRWRHLCGGRIDVCDIPARHQELLAEPYVRELAAKLKASLKKAQSRARKG